MRTRRQRLFPSICFCRASEEMSTKSFQKCFQENVLQKVRICEDWLPEVLLQIVLWVVVSLSTVLAGGAIKHLHKVSDSYKLYESTQSYLFFFDSTPIIHRSAVLRHSEDGDHEQLRKMLKTCSEKGEKGVKQVETMVNRADYRGDTPLHRSTAKEQVECTEVLLKNGAIPMENSENEIPNIGLHLEDPEVVAKLREAKGNNRLSNFCLRQLKSQVQDRGISTELRALLSLQGVGEYQAKNDLLLTQYKDGVRARTALRVKAGEFLEV